MVRVRAALRVESVACILQLPPILYKLKSVKKKKRTDILTKIPKK